MEAQPARLHGLAKVHKQGTPFRPVFSLPGSSYDNLNKTLAKYFDEIDGENIETITKLAREILGKTELVSDQSIISLDVKSFYTNVPLKQAPEIALRRLYEQVNSHETSRKNMKKLLNLAMSKVRFSNGRLPCSNTGQFVAQRIQTCIKERNTKIDCTK